MKRLLKTPAAGLAADALHLDQAAANNDRALWDLAEDLKALLDQSFCDSVI